MIFLWIYVALVIVMSFVTFFFYLADKQKAKKGEWRIKEAVLLGLGVLGGAIGALIAMQTFRHKTKHWYFWVVNIISVILHVVAGVGICIAIF